ncbi:MAG: hypothetical protein WDA70_01425 [Lysobacteraceae bacterium]
MLHWRFFRGKDCALPTNARLCGGSAKRRRPNTASASEKLNHDADSLAVSVGEDTDVHAWVSVIDDLLSDGDTLMSVAAGNNGEMDRTVDNARVQVPSDCVNVCP